MHVFQLLRRLKQPQYSGFVPRFRWPALAGQEEVKIMYLAIYRMDQSGPGIYNTFQSRVEGLRMAERIPWNGHMHQQTLSLKGYDSLHFNQHKAVPVYC
jgi:hypothetical protein